MVRITANFALNAPGSKSPLNESLWAILEPPQLFYNSNEVIRCCDIQIYLACTLGCTTGICDVRQAYVTRVRIYMCVVCSAIV